MKTIWKVYYKKRQNLDPFHVEYIRRRLTAFFGLLIILIMTSACNTQPANNNKVEIEINQAIRIGLFLPTKHKNQIVKDKAKNYYNSAKLAAEDLRPMPLEIILYETDGTPETIQKKAEEAVNDDIQIAIGTLDNAEALPLATILKVSGKKLLSFSAHEKPLGHNIFNMGIGKINLADQVLEYSINEGYDNFLVLEGINQEDDIGLADLKRLIMKKKGTILKYVKVSDTSKYLTEVKSIIEKFHSDSRKEAVIILGTPDQNMVFVLASLKELMAESEGSRIQVIGLSRWSTKSNLLTEPALKNAWFPLINKKRINEFLKRYHAFYGSKPSLESAIAYDSIAAIGALIKNSKETYITDPFSISALTNSSGFLGVLGAFRLLPNGSLERLLGIGESQAGRVKIIKNPPETFY